MTALERQSIEPEQAYIILVEDDPNSYLVVEELLKHAGFMHVYHRSSGTKIMPLLDVLPQIDLILLDIGLPGEDGLTLIQRIRKHPKAAQAHIAAVTANITNEMHLRAKYTGFDSFISKPIRPDQITDQIRAMLKGRAFWW